MTEVDTPDEARKVIWLDEERRLMEERVDEYRAEGCSVEDRRLILQQILAKMRPLFNPPLIKAEWELKKNVGSFQFRHCTSCSSQQDLKGWMNNNGRQGKEHEMTTLLNAWSERRVVGVLKKAEVEAQAKKTSGAVPGEPAYFGHYQNAITFVKNGLSQEDQAHMAALAVQWTKQGCPPAAQAQNWDAHGVKFFQSVAKTAFQDFGMRVLICGTLQDKDGSRVMHLYVPLFLVLF